MSTTHADFTEVAHTMTRRTIAKRLTEAKQQIPHYYVKVTCEIDTLIEARKQFNGSSSQSISLNDLIVRAAALALRKVPEANVSWGDEATRQHHSVDVSVAVATSRGLVTPIVRNADRKSVAEIGAEIKELIERAKRGRLKPEEYNGGHLTVSNLGMYGVDEFSAIINAPQSCILAIGSARREAIVRGEAIAPATLMTVTGSFDHRVVDGATAGQMLAAFKAFLATPQELFSTPPLEPVRSTAT